MTPNKQAVIFACSIALAVGLVAAPVGRSAAAGGIRLFVTPPAVETSRQPSRIIPHLHTKGMRGIAALATETIPIGMGNVPKTSITSGESFTCTVTVASVPADGGYVQINCDTPGALSNGTGSWPLAVYFAPGSSTTASFTLTANTTSSSTSV